MSSNTRVDLNLLKSYKTSFDNEKQSYMYNTYNAFSSGYISQCSDPYVSRMKQDLSYRYQFISEAYNKINTWWTNYNKDIEALENGLCNDQANGNGISESCVRAIVNSLPVLRNFNVDSYMSNFDKKMKGEEYKKHYGQKHINISKVDNFSKFSSTPIQYDENGQLKVDLGFDPSTQKLIIDDNGNPKVVDIAFDLDEQFHRIDPKTGAIISNYEKTDIYGNKNLSQSFFSLLQLDKILNFKSGDTKAENKKNILATGLDVGLSFVSGVIGTVEKAGDAGTVLKPFYGLRGDNQGRQILTNKKYDSDQALADIGFKGADKFIEEIYNTDFGKYVKTNSYITNSKFEETIDATACQIGETVTITTVSKLASLIFGPKSQEIMLGLTGGVIEAGKGAQTAVDYGADYKTTMAFTAARFGVGFVSYFGGAKINTIKISKYAKLSSLVHVGADASTGAVEGMLDIATELILLRKEDGSKYTFKELYEEKGGKTNIISRAATGGILSFLSEAGVLLKFNNNTANKADLTNKQIIADANKISLHYKNFKDIQEKIDDIGNPRNYNYVVNGKTYTFDELIYTNKIDKTKLKIFPVLDLKNELLATIDQNMDPVTKARKLYIELNKRVEYDLTYVIGDEITKGNILNKTLSFDNLESKYVVCKGWSELYKEILIESGFSPEKVIIAGVSGHKWVEIILPDNSILKADATEVINGTIDLANCKLGSRTSGFIHATSDSIGKRINETFNSSIIVTAGDAWKDIDDSIGYSFKGGYANEIMAELTKKYNYGSSDLGKAFMQVIESKKFSTVDGYDAFSFLRQLKDDYGLGSDKVKFDLSVYDKGSVREGFLTIKTYFDDKPKIITISDSTGRHTFSSEKIYEKYVSKLKIIEMRRK
ncbi:MAG: hypothetical protein IKN87_00230 [Bacilli bacterium]|nr:hypothetical protein [Bacilli bacterium]